MKILEMALRSKIILATLPILVLLGILVFASASEAISRHMVTATEDMVYCRPQKESSANLWTCYDYYGNEFKNLFITQQTI
jgi:hypothetical protein